MKQVLVLIIGSTISLLLLMQIAILLVLFVPDVYAPVADRYIVPADVEDGNGAGINAEGADSLAVIPGDSIIVIEPVWEDTITAREHTIAGLRDSIQQYERRLANEDRRIASLEREITALQAVKNEQNTKERQNMARLLESMPPEDAVRILQTTTDKEVRETLQYVNRRQAARIMSLLEPDRAARIMEFTVDTKYRE
jgi:flagellar motility protein MotE (MotC chaperone)